MFSETITAVSTATAPAITVGPHDDGNAVLRLGRPTVLSKLPNELICEIFKYIPYPFIHTLAMVCREWKTFLDEYFRYDLDRRSGTLDFTSTRGFRTYGYLGRVLEHIPSRPIEAIFVNTADKLEDSTVGVLLDIKMTMTPGQWYHYHGSGEDCPLLERFPNLEHRLSGIKELSVDRSVMTVLQHWSVHSPYLRSTAFYRLEALTLHLSIFGDFVNTLAKVQTGLPNLRRLTAECGTYERHNLRGRGGVLLSDKDTYRSIFPALEYVKIGARCLGTPKPPLEPGKPYYVNRPVWTVEEMESLMRMAPEMSELCLSGVVLHSNIFGDGPCVYRFNAAMKVLVLSGCSLKATKISVARADQEPVWSMKRARGSKIPPKRIVFG
ncbi:hypothetical protein BZA70DRAFT_110975 [Myxozyma melibiosi]|uniref:F-box domain-containing protein n=1 Tax=Myxozyma melibiosi TaxID=54550 RepID=A0ABR1F9Y2_9ASCO